MNADTKPLRQAKPTPAPENATAGQAAGAAAAAKMATGPAPGAVETAASAQSGSPIAPGRSSGGPGPKPSGSKAVRDLEAKIKRTKARLAADQAALQDLNRREAEKQKEKQAAVRSLNVFLSTRPPGCELTMDDLVEIGRAFIQHDWTMEALRAVLARGPGKAA